MVEKLGKSASFTTEVYDYFKDIFEILKYLSPAQALFHFRKTGLLLQGFVCRADLYIELFFSVSIEFLSNQRLNGPERPRSFQLMEGHALPIPSLQLLFSVVRNLFAILFTHSSE